jgi:hypothetical protein
VEGDKTCFTFKEFHKSVTFKCVSRKACKDWLEMLHDWQEIFLQKDKDWKGELEVGGGTVFAKLT